MEKDRPLIRVLCQAENDGNIEVIETLSIQDKKQALLIAVEYELYEILIYLLEQGIDLQYVDSRQNNLLHILLDNNVFGNRRRRRRDLLLQCVDKLVDGGVDVNQVNSRKETPIYTAASHRLYEVVIFLLNRGVNLHYVNGRLLYRLLYAYYDPRNIASDLVLQCVVKLMESGVDPNQVNPGEHTPIFTAAMRGLYEVVLYLLELGVDVHYVHRGQRTLMYVLLCSDDVYAKTSRRDLLFQCVVKLVNAGVDANQLNEFKMAPISIAAYSRFYELVIYLLEHCIDTHHDDLLGNNLIHILIRHCNRQDIAGRHDLLLKCVLKVIKDGVDVNQENANKLTPIFIAALRGMYEVVIYLLNFVDVNYVNILKRNILHYVLIYMCSFVKCGENFIQLVNTLLKTELEINQADYRGNTPLFYVGQHHASDDIEQRLGKSYGVKLKLETGQDIYVPLKYKLINILLEAGCNVNHQNEQGQTALMQHIKHQAHISILKLLIRHSDLSLKDNNGDTAISFCIQYHMINSTHIFQTLVDAGSDLMSRNSGNGVKLFLDVLKCKRLDLFIYYIRVKMIVYGFTGEGENMLHLLAGVNYDYSLTKFYWLLNNELDINHRCSKTNTPTMIAAVLLNSKYLELLTRHPRQEINTQNNQGRTALHLCIIGFTMLKDGLNKRQVNDVVQQYCNQIYPIYMACIDSLLSVDGIDVNIPDNKGRTSLMMAAMKNDRVLTRKLLKAGALVNKLDHSGRSALQYLDIYQNVFDLTCFKLLLSNGNTCLLSIPYIDGSTIIQTALCFPCFWEPCRAICFIRYLIAENCCLHILVSPSLECRCNYNQITLTAFSSEERDKLRKLLYLSGTKGEEIMTKLSFNEEDIIHTRGREEFISFCSNISLKSLCRRIIRQNLGLGIQEKVKDLELPRELNGFLLLKDILHQHDYNVDYIDDGWNDFDDDDDYDGYDIDKDREDDYRQYNYHYDYQYVTLNTDLELRQEFLKNRICPNDDAACAVGDDDDEENSFYYDIDFDNDIDRDDDDDH